MGVYITIALRNLLQARRRTALLSFALVLVTALMMLLLSISAGIDQTMVKNATSVMSGHVNVAGFYKSKATDSWPMITGVARIRQIVEDNTEGVEYIADRDRAWAKVISAKSSLHVSPSGIDITDETRLPKVLQLAMESEYKEGGRDTVFGDLKSLEQPGNALIFVSQAKRLGVEIGDYLTITAPTGTGRTNTIDVTVGAIAKDFGFMSNFNMFVTKQDVGELYATAPDSSSVVMIYLKDPSQAEQTMGHLREVFEREGYRLMDHQAAPYYMKFENVAGEDWTGQKLDLTIWKDEVSFLSWISTAINAISFFLVSILMIIIAIGIMNSMWISVRERTVEIGTSRAIGMTRGGVLLMFMAEALLLGLFATTLGACLGAVVAVVVNAASIQVPVDAVKAILMTDVLHLAVSSGQIVTVVFLFTLFTGVSAIWPAFRASRLQPVIAIHHAG